MNWGGNGRAADIFHFLTGINVGHGARVPMPAGLPTPGAFGREPFGLYGANGPLGISQGTLDPGAAGAIFAASGAGRAQRNRAVERGNQRFDAMISQRLGRVDYMTGTRAQVRALTQISGLISARIARTRDITRKLTLEDEVLSIGARIKATREQAWQNFLDTLQVGVARAGLTVGLGDDITALRRVEAAIQARIREVGRTNDLEQQLIQVEGQILDVRRQQAANRHSALVARQFGALGLGPGGEPLTPSTASLRHQLGPIEKSIHGTILDTAANQRILARIRRVLAGGLGAVTKEVRDHIAQMFADWRSQLQQETDGFNLTAADKRRRFLDTQYRDAYHRRHRGVTTSGVVPSHHEVTHVHADGASPERVTAALDRKAFRRRQAGVK
jgi:hypothetical protein